MEDKIPMELENEAGEDRFCTACQQRRSTVGGEWRKTNYGRNNQIARNAAQKKVAPKDGTS